MLRQCVPIGERINLRRKRNSIYQYSTDKSNENEIRKISSFVLREISRKLFHTSCEISAKFRMIQTIFRFHEISKRRNFEPTKVLNERLQYSLTALWLSEQTPVHSRDKPGKIYTLF